METFQDLYTVYLIQRIKQYISYNSILFLSIMPWIMLDKQPICSTNHLYKIAIQLLTFIHKDHSLGNIN